MDYRKINSHIILLLIVLVVGIAISRLGRRVVLEKGFDAGTANIAFVVIMGVCIVSYLAILATLAHTIVPWVMKKLPYRKKLESEVMPESIPAEKNFTIDNQ
jgi:hypothetical protein